MVSAMAASTARVSPSCQDLATIPITSPTTTAMMARRCQARILGSEDRCARLPTRRPMPSRGGGSASAPTGLTTTFRGRGAASEADPASAPRAAPPPGPSAASRPRSHGSLVPSAASQESPTSPKSEESPMPAESPASEESEEEESPAGSQSQNDGASTSGGSSAAGVTSPPGQAQGTASSAGSEAAGTAGESDCPTACERVPPVCPPPRL